MKTFSGGNFIFNYITIGIIVFGNKYKLGFDFVIFLNISTHRKSRFFK